MNRCLEEPPTHQEGDVGGEGRAAMFVGAERGGWFRVMGVHTVKRG